VERAGRVAGMRGRVGQRAENPLELKERPGPAVRHDQRYRVRVRRADVQEVHIEAVDPGGELRDPVQAGLRGPPVVAVGPVAAQVPHIGQRHALRPVRNRLSLRPARPPQPVPQVIQRRPVRGDHERLDPIRHSRIIATAGLRISPG